jgi:hypothetical protein
METAAAMPIWPEPVFAFELGGDGADGEDMIRNLALDSLGVFTLPPELGLARVRALNRWPKSGLPDFG